MAQWFTKTNFSEMDKILYNLGDIAAGTFFETRKTGEDAAVASLSEGAASMRGPKKSTTKIFPKYLCIEKARRDVRNCFAAAFNMPVRKKLRFVDELRISISFLPSTN